MLALDRYPLDAKSIRIQELMNFGFTCFFVVEMCLKILGLGVKDYFRDKFIQFDCLIVILSLLELVLVNVTDVLAASGGVSALRGFRLLRIFKLARSWKSF